MSNSKLKVETETRPGGRGSFDLAWPGQNTVLLPASTAKIWTDPRHPFQRQAWTCGSLAKSTLSYWSFKRDKEQKVDITNKLQPKT